MVRRLVDLLSPRTSQSVLNYLDDDISHRQLQMNGLNTAFGSPPWMAPELDSPEQRAKWDRAAAKPDVIHLKFLGEPAPQGSKQITRWGGLREVSAKIQPWRASVQYASAEQYKGEPITEAVTLDVTFVLPRAKNHYGTGRNAKKLKDSAPRRITPRPLIWTSF